MNKQILSMFNENIIDKILKDSYSYRFIVLLGNKEFKQFITVCSDSDKINGIQVINIPIKSYYRFLVIKDE